MIRTCDSKPKMKNGDVAWKPMGEKDGCGWNVKLSSSG